MNGLIQDSEIANVIALDTEFAKVVIPKLTNALMGNGSLIFSHLHVQKYKRTQVEPFPPSSLPSLSFVSSTFASSTIRLGSASG